MEEKKPIKTHVDFLLEHVPDLIDRSILDIGSGRGNFLIEIASRGGQATGLEVNDAYIQETLTKAAQKGLGVKVIKGMAENLPFENSSFDFVNFALVIEHVEDAQKALEEMSRVTRRGGQIYFGVPNRYGFKDPHFNLYFVNWLPRAWCNKFIDLFGRHKDYSGPAGRQNLQDMHYFTFGEIKKKLARAGFQTIDLREKKIKKILKRSWLYFMALLPYRIHRAFFADSFHLFLVKIR